MDGNNDKKIAVKREKSQIHFQNATRAAAAGNASFSLDTLSQVENIQNSFVDETNRVQEDVTLNSKQHRFQNAVANVQSSHDTSGISARTLRSVALESIEENSEVGLIATKK